MLLTQIQNTKSLNAHRHVYTQILLENLTDTLINTSHRETLHIETQLETTNIPLIDKHREIARYKCYSHRYYSHIDTTLTHTCTIYTF